MTNLPAGPELDRACALAMGYPTHNAFTLSAVPTFSTDPRTDAEKWSWIYERCDGSVNVNGTSSDVIASVRVVDALQGMLNGSGTTISEALARLVVAVAEAKEQES